MIMGCRLYWSSAVSISRGACPHMRCLCVGARVCCWCVDKLHDKAGDRIPVPDHNPLYAQTSLDFLASYPLGTDDTSMEGKWCIQLVRLSLMNFSTCRKYVTETAVNGKERDKLVIGKVDINHYESIQIRIHLENVFYHWVLKHLSSVLHINKH